MRLSNIGSRKDRQPTAIVGIIRGVRTTAKPPYQGLFTTTAFFALFSSALSCGQKGCPLLDQRKGLARRKRGRIRVRGAGNFERDMEGWRGGQDHKKAITIFPRRVERRIASRERYSWTLRGWGGYDYGFLFLHHTNETTNLSVYGACGYCQRDNSACF